VIFAERHPELVKGLILVSPGGLASSPAGQELFLNLLRLPGLGEYIIRLFGEKMSNPDSQSSDLYDQALLPGYVERLKGLERYKGTLYAWLSTIRHFPIQELESSYRAVGDSRKPVLLVWGKEDRVLPFATTEKVRAAIPQVELLALERAGHASHYEKRDVVNAAILNFLRRITPIT
jgi:pimeloyl-ACP methyl ester carboxylesterase